MTDLPAKPGNPLEEFKQRVLEKLKTDIGALMPDEVLGGLVQQAIKDEFFTKQRVPKPDRSYHSTDTIEIPSWFQGEIVRQVEPMLKAAVKDYVAENGKLITDAIAAALDRDKLLLAAASMIGMAVREGMVGAGMEMMQRLKDAGYVRNY